MKDEKMVGNTKLVWDECLLDDMSEKQIQERHRLSQNRTSQIYYAEMIRQMEGKVV